MHTPAVRLISALLLVGMNFGKLNTHECATTLIRLPRHRNSIRMDIDIAHYYPHISVPFAETTAEDAAETDEG